MAAHPYILPTRGSTPTPADYKLAEDLRRLVGTSSQLLHTFTVDEAAALVAAHRCRAEEAVWQVASKALADAA